VVVLSLRKDNQVDEEQVNRLNHILKESFRRLSEGKRG